MGRDKGILNLIEMMTFPEIKKSRNTLLMCVGGPLDAVPGYALHAQKNNIPDDQILFIDHIPNTEIPAWICSCDVVLLPLTLAFMEKIGAMPLKLFEYMAEGIPIVATDLPSLREFLKHEENAVLVEPDSPSAMAKGVHKILSDPEKGKALSSRARQDINKYTWKFKAAKILKSLNL